MVDKYEDPQEGVRMVCAPFRTEDPKALYSTVNFVLRQARSLHPFDALNMLYMVGVTIASSLKVPPHIVFSSMSDCTRSKDFMMDLDITKEQFDELEKKYCATSEDKGNVIPFDRARKSDP